jgi:hypothetical protein
MNCLKKCQGARLIEMAVNAPVCDCVLMYVSLNRRAREASNPVAGDLPEDRGHYYGVMTGEQS